LFARLKKYARYAHAPIATLALWAVLVTLLPAMATAEETPTRTNARANDQDTAHRTDHYVVVAPGDSLWSISERQLGPSATGARIARGVERIYALNRDLIGADPDSIFVGQRFVLPQSLGRHGAERHGAGQAPRQAREPSRAAHRKAPAARPEVARTDRGTGSGPARAAGTAADRSGEDFAGRTTKVPVAAHVRDAREGGSLPDEVPVAPVPAVGQLTAGVTPSSPASYLGGVRAAVSSAASRLIDAVVTDDRYAGRKLLGWALILISLGIGAFPIVLAIWRAIARRKREKDRHRRTVAAAYAAAVPVEGPAHPRVRERTPGGTGSVRSEEHGQSKEPAGSAHGENKGGSSQVGLRRNTGMSGPRRGSARRTRRRMMNRRRNVDGENQGVPDSGRAWQIGEDLRRSIGDIPLRPDKVDDVLAELKPRVEEELRSVALVERSRTLSDREHRQANALRDLLALAHKNPNSKRRV
jgi:LysM domain